MWTVCINRTDLCLRESQNDVRYLNSQYPNTPAISRQVIYKAAILIKHGASIALCMVSMRANGSDLIGRIGRLETLSAQCD